MTEEPFDYNSELQKCFIGLSQDARWSDEIESACKEVLPTPPFKLDPWFAKSYYDAAKPYLRDNILEMIIKAQCGIYDLSYWRKDSKSEWVMPQNVFIEVGIAIGLNRPLLLLQHEESQREGPRLPECLEGMREHILPFTSDISLKRVLRENLPNLVNISPTHEWRKNRHCYFGERICTYRDRHPYEKHWIQGPLPCLVTNSEDYDRDDFREAIEQVLGKYNDIEINYLNELPLAAQYDYLLCTYCQSIRSRPFAIYRITSKTTGETFIAIGISFALEHLFGFKIPKLLLATEIEDVPSLLRGDKVALVKDNIERKKSLHEFIHEAYNFIRNTSWKSNPPLPFIEDIPRNIQKPLQETTAETLPNETEADQVDEIEAESDQARANQAKAYNQEGLGFVFLICHGESEPNVGLPSYPESIGLTERGRKQAQAIADLLKNYPPDLIVTSPYIRARQTAEPTLFAIHNTPERVLAEEVQSVQEFTYLSLERWKHSTTENRRPEVERYWQMAQPDYVDGPGAESFRAFIARVRTFLERLKEMGKEYENIAVFSHEIFINAVLWLIDYNPVEKSPKTMRTFRTYLDTHHIPNGAIVQLRFSYHGEHNYEMITHHLSEKNIIPAQ